MKTLILLLAFLCPMVVFSQTKIVSVDAFDLAYSGGLSFAHESGKSPSRDTTRFRLNLNYAQNFDQYVGLMWKAQVNVNRENIDYGSNDSFSSSYGAGGGVLYNFQPDDIKNSVMAGVMVGLERASYQIGTESEKSGFDVFMNLEAGKRWDLGKYSVANISYAPTVSFLMKRYEGDIAQKYFRNGRDLRFNFLKFDILF